MLSSPVDLWQALQSYTWERSDIPHCHPPPPLSPLLPRIYLFLCVFSILTSNLITRSLSSLFLPLAFSFSLLLPQLPTPLPLCSHPVHGKIEFSSSENFLEHCMLHTATATNPDETLTHIIPGTLPCHSRMVCIEFVCTLQATQSTTK